MAAAAPYAEASWPADPEARICGNAALLAGPATAPDGAIVVPAGDNSSIDFRQPGKTYWFEPGVHTLPDDINGQIIPGDGASFIGAPGAILDGQNKNLRAFTQEARNVTIKYLTIRNFGRGTDNNDQGVVNHNAGENWVITHNTITDNDGAGVFIGSGNVSSAMPW